MVVPLLLPPVLSPEGLVGTASPLVRPEVPVDDEPEGLLTAVPPLRELELEDPLLAVLPLLRVLLELFPVTSEPRENPVLPELLLLEELMVPPWALLVLWLLLFT